MKFIIYSTQKAENKILPFHLSMIKEYVKRLSKYAKIEIIYGNKKINKLSNNSFVFLIDNSKTFSSEKLAKKINELRVSSISEVIFIYDIKQLENFDISPESFSISTMNFTESTSISVLLEQIYRAYKILNNENYHK